jgi:hypothetical protein
MCASNSASTCCASEYGREPERSAARTTLAGNTPSNRRSIVSRRQPGGVPGCSLAIIRNGMSNPSVPVGRKSMCGACEDRPSIPSSLPMPKATVGMKRRSSAICQIKGRISHESGETSHDPFRHPHTPKLRDRFKATSQSSRSDDVPAVAGDRFPESDHPACLPGTTASDGERSCAPAEAA